MLFFVLNETDTGKRAAADGLQDLEVSDLKFLRLKHNIRVNANSAVVLDKI